MTKILHFRPSFLTFSALLLALPALAGPTVVHAAPRDAGGLGSLSTWLMLPFLVAFAVAGHVALGRGAKALAASFQPLASGEPEVAGYERRVYGTSDRAMLEVVAAALAAGLVTWLGVALSMTWLAALGVLGVLGAVAFDMSRWERVTVSASYVWFQRGFGRKVHQVAIENIRDVVVVEEEGTLPTLRHRNHNRSCRLRMRMADKRAVALPKTDAHESLDAVENCANQIRSRLLLMSDKQKDKHKETEKDRPQDAPRRGEPPVLASVEPAPEGGRIPTAHDKEMLRELRRLRKLQQQGHQPASQPASQHRATATDSVPGTRADSEF